MSHEEDSPPSSAQGAPDPHKATDPGLGEAPSSGPAPGSDASTFAAAANTVTPPPPSPPPQGSSSPPLVALPKSPPPPVVTNDSMDVLLETIGAQDKPFAPRRSSASEGATNASYEGGPRTVPPAHTDPGHAPSVILSPSQPPPAMEQGPPKTEPPRARPLCELREDTTRLARKAVDAALADAAARSGAESALPRRGTDTVVVDPRETPNLVARWGLAGVLVALLLLGGAFLKAQLDAPDPAPAPTATTPAPPEAPLQVAPAPRESAAVVPAPSAAPAPEPAPSARPHRRSRGASAEAAGDVKNEAVPAPAASTPKPRPNVPGLEDLKTDY